VDHWFEKKKRAPAAERKRDLEVVAVPLRRNIWNKKRKQGIGGFEEMLISD
jgi:hypothetical protein